MLERPTSVTRALQALAALCVAAGIFTLLVVVRRDELVLAWAEGNPGARAILRDGGIEAVEANLVVPGFVPVVVTSFVTFLCLVGVFAVFFKGGFTWGRVCLGVIALFGVFLAVLGIASDIPTLFDVLAAGLVALCLWLLFELFRPQTSHWLRQQA